MEKRKQCIVPELVAWRKAVPLLVEDCNCDLDKMVEQTGASRGICQDFKVDFAKRKEEIHKLYKENPFKNDLRTSEELAEEFLNKPV